MKGCPCASPSWEDLGAGSSCADVPVHVLGAWEDLGACSEVRAMPAWLEPLQTWCHLQIQSLS